MQISGSFSTEKFSKCAQLHSGSTSKRFIQIGRARGYRTLFMLNSTSDVDSTAHENIIPTNEKFLALYLLDVAFIMRINVKILPFMSRINFVLS